jgi:DNA-binding response OmpR family regulator
MKVLVVDDEPDILMTLRVVLQVAGHEVIEAEDGMTALERAREHPDAMILDIRLPDIDGLEVLRRMSADDELNKIPVLCLSAHSSPRTKDEAISLGAREYMNKPFVAADLRAAIVRIAAPQD